MKRKYIILAVLLLSTLVYSCKKNAVQEISTPITSGAQVKFYNFAINSPVVNFYAGETKISAALSTTGAESATAGVAYAAVYPSTNSYAIISPGSYAFKAKRPSTASSDPDLVLSTLNSQVAEGKTYSLYACGFYNTTAKTTDVFMIEDALPAIDTSGAYVRFVHVSPNANPFNFTMKNTTTNVETLIASNIAYKNGSAFVKLPAGIYDLILRYTSAPTTTVITRAAVNIIKSNTYSFSLRGDITVSATGTATTRPFIDNTPNR